MTFAFMDSKFLCCMRAQVRCNRIFSTRTPVTGNGSDRLLGGFSSTTLENVSLIRVRLTSRVYDVTISRFQHISLVSYTPMNFYDVIR